MLGAIAQSLPIAVGLLLAAMPMVILALVLVIKRPAGVMRAFLGGWALGLAVVGCLVFAVADQVTLADEPAWWAAILKIALGLLLIALAVQKWRSRPGPGDPPKVPKWMASADTMSAGRAFVLAFVLASLNPKNLVLMVAGATVIADATPRVFEQLVALAVFVVVASLGVAAPAVIKRVLGTRSGPVLAAADRWMTANNAVIMSVVLLVLGVLLLINGGSAL